MSKSNSLPDWETLAGTWQSPALEPMPLHEAAGARAMQPNGNQIFISRTFDFDDKSWRVRFSGWADSQRISRLFDGIGEGNFELQDAWSPVPGARAAIFHFSRRLFVVHTPQLAQKLSESRAGDGHWAPGIQQDVSLTGALFVPSIVKVGVEYDMLAFDSGPNGERDLYLGDRSHEMNQPDLRPKKRNPFPVRRMN